MALLPSQELSSTSSSSGIRGPGAAFSLPAQLQHREVLGALEPIAEVNPAGRDFLDLGALQASAPKQVAKGPAILAREGSSSAASGSRRGAAAATAMCVVRWPESNVGGAANEPSAASRGVVSLPVSAAECPAAMAATGAAATETTAATRALVKSLPVSNVGRAGKATVSKTGSFVGSGGDDVRMGARDQQQQGHQGPSVPVVVGEGGGCAVVSERDVVHKWCCSRCRPQLKVRDGKT